MEENVTRFLRAENINRVFESRSSSGLFQCLSSAFNIPLSDIHTTFQGFMRREEEMELFPNVLQLLDNTGNVPVKEEGESDSDFKRRLGECYNGIVDGCTNTIQPYTEFLHVYVFAIATMIGRPIFILHEDEAGDLSWSYFPPLYSHTCDAVRNEPRYTTHHYITMFFSTDQCYKIDSSRCQREPPTSYGMIGVYYKQLKAILLREDIVDRSVRQMKRWLARPDIQQKLQGCLSRDIMIQTIEMYEKATQGNIYSRNHGVVLPSSLSIHQPAQPMSAHRPKRNDFMTELLNNLLFLECLYKVSVNNKNGHLIWSAVESNDGFLPAEFRNKLFRLENTVLELQAHISEYMNQCTDATTEFNERRGRVNRAVIGGSAVGIIGGGLAIAGLILTPFTFGASLGLTIAGASLGAAGGVVGGTARAVEGVKQNSRVNEINEIQGQITEHENQFVEQLRDVETIIESHAVRNFEHTIEGPGVNRKGFLAIGSAFRSVHGTVAIALAAVRVGAAGVAIAASVLGPLSLALDIGFLAEAAHDLRKGSQTGAGKILNRNAKAVNMKMKFYNCMVRGNISTQTWIVD